MARAARHIELAVRYLQTSATLQNGGFNNEAAEMVWGAIVNAIESIGHVDAGNERRNLNNRARRDLARNLPATAFSEYHDAQTNLHDHFYHDTLNEEEFPRLHRPRPRLRPTANSNSAPKTTGRKPASLIIPHNLPPQGIALGDVGATLVVAPRRSAMSPFMVSLSNHERTRFQ